MISPFSRLCRTFPPSLAEHYCRARRLTRYPLTRSATPAPARKRTSVSDPLGGSPVFGSAFGTEGADPITPLYGVGDGATVGTGVGATVGTRVGATVGTREGTTTVGVSGGVGVEMVGTLCPKAVPQLPPAAAMRASTTATETDIP